MDALPPLLLLFGPAVTLAICGVLLWLRLRTRVRRRTVTAFTRHAPFSEADLAAIENYLIHKTGRTRDLALLYFLHETKLSYDQVCRIVLDDAERHPGKPFEVDLEEPRVRMRLSVKATDYLLRWIGEAQIQPNEPLFPVSSARIITQPAPRKMMPVRRMKDLVRAWRSKALPKTKMP